MDSALALRLAKIADASYAITASGPMTTDPSLGFLQPAIAYDAGTSDIDAAMLGVTGDGIVLAFRGTVPLEFNQGQGAFITSLHDWLADGQALLVLPSDPSVPGRVHQGFRDCEATLRNLFVADLKALLGSSPAGTKFYITGHSKGGAVGMISAAVLQAQGVPAPDAICTFAAPKPGDIPFVTALKDKIPSAWRFEYQDDIVPHLPPTAHLLEYLASIDPSLSALSDECYVPSGILEFLNWDTPPILENESTQLDVERAFRLACRLASLQLTDIARCHDLANSYIPAIAGEPAPNATQIPVPAYPPPYTGQTPSITAAKISPNPGALLSG